MASHVTRALLVGSCSVIQYGLFSTVDRLVFVASGYWLISSMGQQGCVHYTGCRLSSVDFWILCFDDCIRVTSYWSSCNEYRTSYIKYTNILNILIYQI